MRIGALNMHCGECDIIDFCGNSFGYCVCNQERFQDVDTEEYRKHAEQAETTCFSFYSGYEKECDVCENEEEARDYYCEQIAEYVAVLLSENLDEV